MVWTWTSSVRAYLLFRFRWVKEGIEVGPMAGGFDNERYGLDTMELSQEGADIEEYNVSAMGSVSNKFRTKGDRGGKGRRDCHVDTFGW